MSVAVIVAMGVNTDGRRDVLGMTTGHSEAEQFWIEFLRSLARRGLRGAILLEQNDERSVWRARDMTLETVAPLSDDLTISLPHWQPDRPDNTAKQGRCYTTARDMIWRLTGRGLAVG